MASLRRYAFCNPTATVGTHDILGCRPFAAPAARQFRSLVRSTGLPCFLWPASERIVHRGNPRQCDLGLGISHLSGSCASLLSAGLPVLRIVYLSHVSDLANLALQSKRVLERCGLKAARRHNQRERRATLWTCSGCRLPLPSNSAQTHPKLRLHAMVQLLGLAYLLLPKDVGAATMQHPHERQRFANS